jgi:ribosome-associated toxin RatA of RatAB toxin-antitoxin module
VDTTISRRIAADPRAVFELAAAVEDWPTILPHYRWVRVLDEHGDGRRTVEMAAQRQVFRSIAIPLRWTAVESINPDEHTIFFEHVKGISRGMRVTWTIEPHIVRIRHIFEPRWPVPDALVEAIVGEYFVNGVARRTLKRIGDLAERRGWPDAVT